MSSVLRDCIVARCQRVSLFSSHSCTPTLHWATRNPKLRSSSPAVHHAWARVTSPLRTIFYRRQQWAASRYCRVWMLTTMMTCRWGLRVRRSRILWKWKGMAMSKERRGCSCRRSWWGVGGSWRGAVWIGSMGRSNLLVGRVLSTTCHFTTLLNIVASQHPLTFRSWSSWATANTAASTSCGTFFL